MTGGGAKGLYEAGVIHAFHITGMEFDIITGSSIGAMNSVFFAEYLYQKRPVAEVRADPLQAVEALDPLVKAYHHAWLLMPDKRVVDDSPQGRWANRRTTCCTSTLACRSSPASAGGGPILSGENPGATGLARTAQIAGRAGRAPGRRRASCCASSRTIARAPVQEAMRTYLARFGMDHSVIPPGEECKIKDIFTQPVSPAAPRSTWRGAVNAQDGAGVKLFTLVDPARTLRRLRRAGH